MNRIAREQSADLALVAGLGLLAILGLRNAYDGWSFLVIGAAALGTGMVLAQLLLALRQPALVVAASALVAYFALGAVLVVPAQSFVERLVQLARVSITGWKDLLTTMPPVGTDTGLLVVPYAIGMITGVCGVALARLAQPAGRRVRPGGGRALARAVAPVVAPALGLGLALALSTDEPAAAVLHGGVFAALSLLWTSSRIRRVRPRARGRAGTRSVVGVGILAVAAAVSVTAVPALVGAPDRTVLRDYVVPPLNLSEYPSPLVGFRKYTKDANRLWDQTLFTVTGVPAGTWIRIATLDDYDGTVWGATDEEGFARVGPRLDTSDPTLDGQATVVRVTIAAAYAVATDVNPWLPGTGVVRGIDFGGPRARELAGGLFYNKSTSSFLVPARLQEGDTYTLTTILGPEPELPEDAQPYGRPALTEDARALLTNKVAAWVGDASNLTDQLEAVAAYLREHGAYTNGGPGEGHFLPGHGLGRLGSFLTASTPAGDDEQYAATFALVANYLGIPARVVFGARPDEAGVVRGSSIHAAVEVHVADGTDAGVWVPIPESRFMPDVSKRPDQEPPQDFEEEQAAVVPPPNAVRLPATPTDTSRNDPVAIEEPEQSLLDRILGFLLRWLRYVGPPIVVILLFVGIVLGAKSRRRRRRRRRGVVANRYDGAWQELLDFVRDMAAVVPPARGLRFNRGLTRQQQARLLDDAQLLRSGPRGRPKHNAAAPTQDEPSFQGLARTIERVVFGAGEPTPEQAEAFWRHADRLRDRLLRNLGPVRRLVVALNPRSLRPEILPVSRPTHAAEGSSQ